MADEHGAPTFIPCKRGLWRVRCGTHWTSRQKFKTVEAAEAFWAKHVRGEVR